MPSEEVFRFLNVRPVQQASPERINRGFAVYDTRAKSPFHRAVETLAGPDARQKAVELAHQRLSKDDLDGQDLKTMLAAVQKAAAESTASAARKVAEKALDQPLAAYLKSQRARRLRDALWDRLYAHTLAPEVLPEQRDRVYEGVRSFHFLEVLAEQAEDEMPLSLAELSAVRATLPQGLILGLPAADRSWRDRYSEQLNQELDTTFQKVVKINAAIEDLSNSDRVFKAQELRTVADFTTAELPNIKAARTIRLTGPAVELTRERGDDTLETVEIAGRLEQAPEAEQKLIMVPKKAPWVFEEFGQKNLSKPTLELLATRKFLLHELEVAEIVTTLEGEKYEIVAGYLNGLPSAAVQYVRNSSQFQYLIQNVAVAGFEVLPFEPATPLPAPDTASARGIRPLGIGDLLVVKQELLRYTAGEVAHIENVLKSEFKTRTHSRLREIEEIIITETEELEESEKDLQTTERFELQKEAQRTIESQMSLEAGVSVTASYGPVSVTAHADFALSQSTSEANRIASTFARQITERSVSRIMRRAREVRTRRTLERFEETNEHGFDNKTGTGHVIGIYRWVDKYYKARLINYGRRLLMEFIVPEPAAFYLYLQSKQTLQGVNMEKPEEPRIYGRRLEPTDLTKYNYTYYVAKYNVQDVDPYPAEVVRVSAAFAESAGSKENMDYAKTSEKLNVPQGYKCYDVFGELGWQGYGSKYFIECFIAGQRWGSVTAAGLEGIIPISIKGWISAFHVNVVAICELKSETKKAWQLKTYEAIMNAYEQALAAYNEQVATAQIQAGVQIEGRNPDLNRKIERDELKKGVIRLLTDNFAQTRVGGTWRFDEMFNAMQSGGQFGYPEFDVDESLVEGRIIQFYEQAFEWNNVTYRFYPYVWGRKDGWKDIFPLTDVDPLFTDFLRAGAARVVIAVHPAYNEAVLHYLATNEIWNGGSPPTLYDPLFISIVDEIKADSGASLDNTLPACAPDSEYPCLADEWEVKLPTTLVYLQEDAQLPDFTS